VVRHRGCVVDTEQRRVCDRDGEWYPLDRLEVAGRTLYYARPLHFEVLTYHERWLIPDEGWSISRFQFTPLETDPVDWYIEMELIDVEGPLWTVLDGYLDMFVWEGHRARLDDADELGDGLAAGSISVEEAATVLRSLDRLCDELHDNGNSGVALLGKYAPGLPT
jgi:predicted RNA-binding protein associated with RNAse of E/G family